MAQVTVCGVSAINNGNIVRKINPSFIPKFCLFSYLISKMIFIIK